MTTAERILQATQLKPDTEDGTYRGPSPIRPNSDGNAFRLTVEPDGEHGTWYDHKTQEGGSLYELAAKLGIDTPDVAPARNTHRQYSGLSDYARAHGVPAEVFKAAGWQEVEHANRPALAIPTRTGTRHRYIDGSEPRYRNPKGYEACWYGLERAVRLAKSSNSPLILCNGEASTVVAQHYGLSACCVPGGERKLSDAMLQALNDAWTGAVAIALDCDDAGRKAADAVAEQIEGALVVDLGLSDGGDLADFCMLHGHSARGEFETRIPDTWSRTENSHTVALQMIEQLDVAQYTGSKPFVIPFASLHALGGLAHVVMPRKMIAIVAPSGHGKTTFLETWVDSALIRGESGMWYGPEWSPAEYHNRRVQRYGGPTVAEMKQWELYKWHRDNRDKSSEWGMGMELSPEKREKYVEISRYVSDWFGRLEYFPPDLHIEYTLELMSRHVDRARADGRTLNFAVFDYIQLLQAASRNYDGNQYEYATSLIKQFCQEYELVGIVGSQVNKAATRTATDNVIIEPAAMHYIREDKFNLAITLNVVYEPDLSTIGPDGEPIMRPTPAAYAAVVKNSEGKKGESQITLNHRYLRWMDQPYRPNRVNLSDL